MHSIVGRQCSMCLLHSRTSQEQRRWLLSFWIIFSRSLVQQTALEERANASTQSQGQMFLPAIRTTSSSLSLGSLSCNSDPCPVTRPAVWAGIVASTCGKRGRGAWHERWPPSSRRPGRLKCPASSGLTRPSVCQEGKISDPLWAFISVKEFGAGSLKKGKRKTTTIINNPLASPSRKKRGKKRILLRIRKMD